MGRTFPSKAQWQQRPSSPITAAGLSQNYTAFLFHAPERNQRDILIYDIIIFFGDHGVNPKSPFSPNPAGKPRLGLGIFVKFSIGLLFKKANLRGEQRFLLIRIAGGAKIKPTECNTTIRAEAAAGRGYAAAGFREGCRYCRFIGAGPFLPFRNDSGSRLKRRRVTDPVGSRERPNNHAAREQPASGAAAGISKGRKRIDIHD